MILDTGWPRMYVRADLFCLSRPTQHTKNVRFYLSGLMLTLNAQKLCSLLTAQCSQWWSCSLYVSHVSVFPAQINNLHRERVREHTGKRLKTGRGLCRGYVLRCELTFCLLLSVFVSLATAIVFKCNQAEAGNFHSNFLDILSIRITGQSKTNCITEMQICSTL